MATEIHQGKKREYTLSFTKADGSPGIVEGSPTWELSPPEVGTIAQTDNGLTAFVTWSGVATGAILKITADGDLGEGVFPIVIQDQIDFIAPLGAVSGSLAVGEEVPA